MIPTVSRRGPPESDVPRSRREGPVGRSVAIAAGVYPFVPVRWLMKDQYRSDLHVAKVTAPVLVMHGDRDDVVPIASGEQLYKLITSPKRFVCLAGGGHETLGSFGVVETARGFVAETFK